MKATNAIKVLLMILTLVIIFHLLILGGAIPYGITWGGRLKTDAEMYVFESISILINLFLAFILIARGRLSRLRLPSKFTTITLRFFFILFVLNTIGNLFAETNLEKCFSILTLVFSVLIFMILRGQGRSGIAESVLTIKKLCLFLVELSIKLGNINVIIFGSDRQPG